MSLVLSIQRFIVSFNRRKRSNKDNVRVRGRFSCNVKPKYLYFNALNSSLSYNK